MSQQPEFPISVTPQNISAVGAAGRVMGRRYRAQAPPHPIRGLFLWCVAKNPPDNRNAWHTLRGGEYIEFCGGQNPPVRVRIYSEDLVPGVIFSMSVSSI